MTVEFRPSRLCGKVAAPPSKSVAHRALICGALTPGAEIKNVAYSQDILATLECLQELGATVEKRVDSVFVGGLNIKNAPDNAALNCRESGSTLRFLIPLCLVSGKRLILTGSERLLSRPLSAYKELCRQNGLDFAVSHSGVALRGPLCGGDFKLRGDISSQFITGLLLALPLAGGRSVLHVEGAFESRPYVDITVDIMHKFGIDVVCDRSGDRFEVVPGDYMLRGGGFTVEGDFSNAAYIEALSLLGGSVEVTGLPPAGETKQGDSVYRRYFAELSKGKREFDLSDCPDLAPIMFALAAYCNGGEFSGTSRLAAKESDRAAAMSLELQKFGADVHVYENSVKIASCGLHAPTAPLSSHNDHRVVMALSALCCVYGGVIEDAGAVDKSFPNYFEKLRSLNAEFTCHEA